MRRLNSQKGQSLISLLFFMVIGITVIASATIILTTDILSASTQEQSAMSYYAAESGIEDALLRTLRNPTLTVSTSSPYTITTSDGTASVSIQNSISGGTITDTIVSTGISGSTTRKIQAVTGYVGGKRTVTSWIEIQ
jgi:hypothetical protein